MQGLDNQAYSAGVKSMQAAKKDRRIALGFEQLHFQWGDHVST